MNPNGIHTAHKRDTLFPVKSNVWLDELDATAFWLDSSLMHEMSVITSLLSIVREEMTKHEVQHLLLVRIRYGALANIVPEALSFAFEALTAGTELDGAVLETEEIPVTLRCTKCNGVFTPEGKDRFFAPCPACGELNGHHMESGRELYIQHIEAE